MVKDWIEAMRLRTLPVSVAGVVGGTGYAALAGAFAWQPALLCLVFAVLSQVASNFANEYYDYRAGLDRPGREGPRRGVTEGDISPRAMQAATFATLALACGVGLWLMRWGGVWLLAVGIAIAAGVLAYSTGPYPLSRHGWGEVAVTCFFGVVPVNFTYYLQAGDFTGMVMAGSVAIGLMGANVLIVNNYRDADDDAGVGKRTLVVLLGRRVASMIYFFNGFAAVLLMLGTWMAIGQWWLFVPAAYVLAHTMLWLRLTSRSGRALNPLLGQTSVLMLAYAAAFLAAAFLS